MKEKTKLKLDDLKVESFVTSNDDILKAKVIGGTDDITAITECTSCHEDQCNTFPNCTGYCSVGCSGTCSDLSNWQCC